MKVRTLPKSAQANAQAVTLGLDDCNFIQAGGRQYFVFESTCAGGSAG